MKASVNIESLRGSQGEFLLVNVSGGDGVIGVCDTTNRRGTQRSSFYVGSECIINILNNGQDAESNRQIWQTSTLEKCKNVIGTLLPACCDAYFKDGLALSKAMMPIFEILTPGLYVVHVNNVFPTDGAGNFFWNAYTVKHELNGSAEHIPIIDDHRDYSPMFLVPTKNFADFTEKNFETAVTRLKKGKHLGGIAYHLSGMFSALLYGHTNATACLSERVDFSCIIIEPLNKVLVDVDSDSPTKGKIVALSCPYVNIGFDVLSRKMTESFLLNRKGLVNQDYEIIKAKAEKMISGVSYSKKLTPEINARVEALPDADMMISAHAVRELNDEDLALLLSGETKVDDQYIISQNYYESIVYACNFLQYTDRNRFIEFAKAILENPDLSATYVYVAGRLKYVMDARINEIFKNISESEDPIYSQIKAVADSYLEEFMDYTENSVSKFLVGDATFDEEIYEISKKDESNYSSLALAKQMGSRR